VRERAVGALGQVGHGEAHAVFRNELLQALFALAPTKDLQLQFAVGRALALVGTGAPPPPSAAAADGVAAPAAVLLPPIVPPKRASVAAISPMAATVGLTTETTTEEKVAEAAALTAAAAAAALEAVRQRGDVMEYVLKRVLAQYVVDWTPLVRQAAACWLLTLLQTAGEAAQVRAVAAEVQKALIGLLADSNETTQELAAKVRPGGCSPHAPRLQPCTPGLHPAVWAGLLACYCGAHSPPLYGPGPLATLRLVRRGRARGHLGRARQGAHLNQGHQRQRERWRNGDLHRALGDRQQRGAARACLQADGALDRLRRVEHAQGHGLRAGRGLAGAAAEAPAQARAHAVPVHLRPQPEDPRRDEAGLDGPRARAQEDARRAAAARAHAPRRGAQRPTVARARGEPPRASPGHVSVWG
jgi:hypothetical protein